MTTSRFVLAALLLSACAPAAEVDGEQEAIVGGTTDTTDRAVVYIYASYGANSESMGCSGAIIAPGVVLTAAHCLLPNAGTPPELNIGFANSYSSQIISSGGASSYVANPAFDLSNPQAGHDTGIIFLSGDTTVPALAYDTTAPTASWVGTTARLVGYGSTSDTAGNGGTRRDVELALTGYTTADLFYTGGTKSICHGDSGGPALRVSDNAIVGIASFASSGCSSTSYFSRIDTDAAFINAQVASAGGSSGSTTTTTPTTHAQTGGCNVARTDAREPVALAALVALAGIAAQRRRKRA